jgi:molybdopterin-guanine dinucleotide biosynthesis protein A
MNGGLGARQRIGGIILCGGRSRRMGSPKEWIRAGDEYLLSRLVRVVGEACSPVVVAGRRDQALPPLPAAVGVVNDAFEDIGPLAGLLAGMERLSESTDAVFVTPGDHFGLRKAFIDRLIERLADHPAVVIGYSGTVFPLLGIYRSRLVPDLRRMITMGERAAWRFAETIGAIAIPAEEFHDVDGELASLRNANSPGDFQEFDDGGRAIEATRGDSCDR